MHDSYTELVLPFGSSAELLEEYMNAHGGIRTGKLMEHLDSLAGSISYKHVLGPGIETLGRIKERGFYIVTASVDRLDMLTTLDPSRDLRLSGQVIYTGKSSMEVAVKMESIGGDKAEETVMIGRFSMVCRDAHTHKARPVNTLSISSPAEHTLYSLGEAIKRRRSSLAARSLDRVPPSSVEASYLHSHFLKYGKDALPRDADWERVWMGDTKAEKCMLMFPQERNVHGKVFGGYLMRMAYELGFANGSMFVQGPMSFLSLDSISFAAPVPIGSILRLSSHILHTKEATDNHPTRVHVGVTANVVDVKTGSELTTNEFRFTWRKSTADKSWTDRVVVPETYQESMSWLEGKRALDVGDQIRGMRDQKTE
ncbi:Thioesterase/thiol ester dehydrase-isomerase [Cylindrobasidium torrendii FP15055 ss-10]|uniref:Thioesterase/thiol ester dehydrase-isomerase n=1 Tax=Cylindrobasidium torrendii FP15055 ss-10 TaxID=1314674 RepID=A0A0D7AWB9_9AGAR|nr:Thioesterase/thiol ester dehydrase-isomerase [Cylindrobasidium torrendii FP15055 ss-10]